VTDTNDMTLGAYAVADLDFDDPKLFGELERQFGDPGCFDDVAFGVIAMGLDGTVVAYNRAESEFSGISPSACLGINFFSDIAPCTNNYLVSGRFAAETQLDETIDYVFTLKMRPTRVRLRMLKAEPSPQQYLLVRRR
jgi:photoactive yellow protein